MNKIFIFIFFFLYISLQAQQNELRIDVLGFTFKECNISYERILGKKIGFEIGMGYIYYPQRLHSYIYNNAQIYQSRVLEFKKTSWNLMFATKYYVSPKYQGNRLFIGNYLMFRSKPKIEEAFYSAFEENNNVPFNSRRNTDIIVGATIGYKFLILKERISIEPTIGFGLEMVESFIKISNSGMVYDGYIKMNLGYRFGL